MAKIVIQSRLGNTRFPEKDIQDLWNGMNTLRCMIERLRKNLEEEIIIAVPEKDYNRYAPLYNDSINNVFVKTGPEEDVLKRMCEVTFSNFTPIDDAIIELTADCPLIDPQLIRKMLLIYNNQKLDYISNTITRCMPDGFDIQIYGRRILVLAEKIISDPIHREHGGWNIINYSNAINTYLGEPLKVANLSDPAAFYPHWSLTVDEPKDLELIRKIYKHFNRLEFNYLSIIDYLNKNPELLKINDDVKRKYPGT